MPRRPLTRAQQRAANERAAQFARYVVQRHPPRQLLSTYIRRQFNTLYPDSARQAYIRRVVSTLRANHYQPFVIRTAVRAIESGRDARYTNRDLGMDDYLDDY